MRLRALGLLLGLALIVSCDMSEGEVVKPAPNPPATDARAKTGGGDEKADAKADDSWLEGLPSSQYVDPATDDTLLEIFDYIDDLSSEQMHDVAALYIELREDQYAVLARYDSGGGEKSGEDKGRSGGKAGKMGGGGKMGGKAGRRRANRRDSPGGGGGKATTGGPGGGSGAGSDGGYPQEAHDEIAKLNESFLAEGRKLMREEQLNSWDDCSKAIDLDPPELSGGGSGGGSGGATSGAPQDGKQSPEISLKTIDGKDFELSSLKGKPTVLQFGSWTCPAFRKEDPKLDSLRKQYGDKLQWVLVYGYEAHPTEGPVSNENVQEGIEISQPKTYEERLEVARVAQDELDMDDIIIIDNMDDEVTNTWDAHPNHAWVIDADGVIIEEQRRIMADNLTDTLQSLL